MSARKLTPEQQTARLLFIGRCVDGNITLPNASKFGVSQPMTVQDLSNSNTATLQKVGQALEKLQAEKGSGRFAQKTTPTTGGIPINEWMDFIELTLINKEALEEEANTAAEIKQLQRELDSLDSPEERKQKVRARLTELQGTPTAAPATV